MTFTSTIISACCLALSVASSAEGRGTGGGHSRSSYSTGGHSRSYSFRSASPKGYSSPRLHYGSSSHRSSISHFHAASYRGARSHSYSHTARYSFSAARDGQGRIARSSAARYAFMARTGYPHGRPGYVVDHTVPLKRGGTDAPSNMQWQTKDAAKAKDRWE